MGVGASLAHTVPPFYLAQKATTNGGSSANYRQESHRMISIVDPIKKSKEDVFGTWRTDDFEEALLPRQAPYQMYLSSRYRCVRVLSGLPNRPNPSYRWLYPKSHSGNTLPL